MKKIILLISVSLLSLSSFAQGIPKNTAIRYFNDIGNVLITFYHPNIDSVKNNCWEGCVFIRFNLSKDGKFININYTATTPIFIKNAIANAFLKINEKGANIEHLENKAEKNYILPLIVVNKDGCGFLTGWEDKSYKPDKKMAIIYEKRQMNFEQFANSLGNMTNFTGSKLDFITDCVLLKPVSTPVVMY